MQRSGKFYSNLAAEIARSGLRHSDVAETAGMSKDGFSKRVTGTYKKGFTVDEAIAIRDAHFPNLDVGYLFRRD